MRRSYRNTHAFRICDFALSPTTWSLTMEYDPDPPFSSGHDSASEAAKGGGFLESEKAHGARDRACQSFAVMRPYACRHQLDAAERRLMGWSGRALDSPVFLIIAISKYTPNQKVSKNSIKNSNWFFLHQEWMLFNQQHTTLLISIPRIHCIEQARALHKPWTVIAIDVQHEDQVLIFEISTLSANDGHPRRQRSSSDRN
jgi:hypothetical protein